MGAFLSLSCPDTWWAAQGLDHLAAGRLCRGRQGPLGTHGFRLISVLHQMPPGAGSLPQVHRGPLGEAPALGTLPLGPLPPWGPSPPDPRGGLPWARAEHRRPGALVQQLAGCCAPRFCVYFAGWLLSPSPRDCALKANGLTAAPLMRRVALAAGSRSADRPGASPALGGRGVCTH